jgi:hypothetical protein
MNPLHSGERAGTDQIIERQMLLRSARDRAAHEYPLASAATKFRFVTISRQVGSFGELIAEDLAERLGWRIYDREIVETISRDSHTRESLVQQLDEKSQTLFHDTVKRLFGMAEGGSLGVEAYHILLVKTLLSLGTHGRAILVGRGANFALQGQPGLHVRIVASLKVRQERLAAFWKVDEREASRRMLRLDEERRAFVRRHYKQDPDDPRHYDAVYNTDTLSHERITAAILATMDFPKPSLDSK